MFEKEQNLNKYMTINKFQEDQEYQRDLLGITMFPSINVMNRLTCFKGTLNFSLKDVGFNKKKSISIFFSDRVIDKSKMYRHFIFKKCVNLKIKKRGFSWM